MLCTAARGGMRSVVEAYRRDGLFARHDIRLIETHDEGSVMRRLGLATKAMFHFVRALGTGRVIGVHIHVAMRGSFWRKSAFAAVADWFNVPVLLHLHGSEMKQFFGEQPEWRKRLIRHRLESCHSVLVLSRSWAEFIGRIAPGACIVELPNYVVVPPLPMRTPGRGFVELLFLGLVGQRKGIYDLLEAMAASLPRAPALRLRIAGNGEIEQARRKADALGLGDRVEFLGWVSSERRDSLLAAADIYVLPSHNEGLPMSVLEAMAWALPVVTTTVGGIPELVTSGTDGVLVNPGDVPALTDALILLGNNGELRDQLGSQARRRVEQSYSDRSVLPRLEEVYAQLSTNR